MIGKFTVQFGNQFAVLQLKSVFLVALIKNMNPLRITCLMACFLAAALAGSSHNHQNQMSSRPQKYKPSQWLSAAELQQTPAVDEITIQRLENMSVEKGAQVLERIYHISQINHDLRPSYTPNAENVNVYFFQPNGQKVATTLNQMAAVAKQQPGFGDEEVTIYITGLPASNSPSVQKANRKLINAYLQHYSNGRQVPSNVHSQNNGQQSSSDEDVTSWNQQAPSSSGNLVVIDLGEQLNFKKITTLDVESAGQMVGQAIIDVTEAANVPNEIVHVVAQGVAAHVAGAAGNEYSRQTGRQLRRITALDPSKVYARNPKVLTGLSRGDAEFVDAIHTATYSMGTPQRVGDVDFFPNGPSKAVAGANNVVEASARAIRYFAESVVPGNERNFPAVAANSVHDYKNNNGYGKRVYMGINTDYDVEGDYILQVNENSPFGQSAPARKQSHYHGAHSSLQFGNDN